MVVSGQISCASKSLTEDAFIENVEEEGSEMYRVFHVGIIPYQEHSRISKQPNNLC